MSTTSVGKLADSPIAELLAHAFSCALSGTLVLDRPGAEKASVEFVQGTVIAVQMASASEGVALESLREVLPADTLKFVTAHANRQECEIIEATEKLSLLPPETMALVRGKCLAGTVVRMASLPPETLFGFFPKAQGQRAAPPGETATEPLSLIYRCILAEGSLDRVRDLLESIRQHELRLVDAGQALRARFPPPLPMVIQKLRAAPRSLDELKALELVPIDQLLALVHTLRITRQLLMAEERRSSPPAGMPASRVPRRGSSHVLRRADPANLTPPQPPAEMYLPPHLQAALRPARLPRTGRPMPSSAPPDGGFIRPRRDPGSLPPRPSIEAPEKSEQELRRQWPERAAEARALQKWADATGDAEQTERASLAVDRLAKLFPNNTRIRYYNGCLHGMAGRVDAALSEFRAVLRLDPNNVEAPVEMGRLVNRSDRR